MTVNELANRENLNYNIVNCLIYILNNIQYYNMIILCQALIIQGRLNDYPLSVEITQ